MGVKEFENKRWQNEDQMPQFRHKAALDMVMNENRVAIYREKIRSALVYHASHRFNQLITPNQFDEAALAVLTALGEVK